MGKKLHGIVVVLLVLLALAVSACGGAGQGGSVQTGTDGAGSGQTGDGGDGGGAGSPGDGDGASSGQVSGPALAFCTDIEDTDDRVAQREIWNEHRDVVLETVAAALDGQTGVAAMDAVQAALPCLLVEPRGAGPDLLIIGMPDYNQFDVTAQQNIIAWPWDDGWGMELLQLPLEDPVRNIIKVMRGAGGTELLVTQHYEGTGHFGAFELYRAGAKLERLWESEVFLRFSPNVLNGDRLLALYRADQIAYEPHYFEANCCQPTNGQSLFERDGDRYMEVAFRLHPSPHYTASLFAGAINDNDYDLAVSLVTDEMLLQPLVGADGSFERIELDEPPALVWDIDYYEAWHWDVLGPDSGEPHAVTEVSWPVPSHNMTMLLQRIDNDWKVVGWE